MTTIEAGKPYIIKWDNTGQHLTESDLVFEGVIVKSGTTDVPTDYVDFIGTFSPEVIYENGTEKHNLYLGEGNTLYWPSTEGFQMKSCRAYFKLKNELFCGSSANVRAFNLRFGDEEETGITNTNRSNDTNSDHAWYTLDGRKLTTKPTQKGVYIHEGNKVVIK